ncbi:putative serine/threonine-protein phosphatase 6 regulatory ankyrin repeat subunit C-like 4, partial [Homarus americanus]
MVNHHLQDAAGRTFLHWAAELGYINVVGSLLDMFELYPHAVTWDGETPADLARRRGHQNVLHRIQNHRPPQVQGSPEELYNQLLSRITQGDDYVQGCHLLCSGAPLESPSGSSTQPLPLAITSNRREMVSLLLVAGAPLTTTCNGFNLLTLAWFSPDVTPPVQVIITR